MKVPAQISLAQALHFLSGGPILSPEDFAAVQPCLPAPDEAIIQLFILAVRTQPLDVRGPLYLSISEFTFPGQVYSVSDGGVATWKPPRVISHVIDENFSVPPGCVTRQALRVRDSTIVFEARPPSVPQAVECTDTQEVLYFVRPAYVSFETMQELRKRHDQGGAAASAQQKAMQCRSSGFSKTYPNKQVIGWYKAYIEKHCLADPPLTRDEDVAAMRVEFPGIPRGVVWKIRAEHAPEHWKSKGRRKR